MRNALIRILQVLVIVAVASSFAHAFDFVHLKKKAAAGGACSTLVDNPFTTVNGAWPVSDTAGRTYLGPKWTNSFTGSICKISVLLYRGGTLTGKTLTAKIYDTSGGNPNTLIDTATNTPSAATITTDTGGEWVDFSFSSASLTATVAYFIIINMSSAGDGTNHLHWVRQDTGGATAYAQTEGTWSVTANYAPMLKTYK